MRKKFGGLRDWFWRLGRDGELARRLLERKRELRGDGGGLVVLGRGNTMLCGFGRWGR